MTILKPGEYGCGKNREIMIISPPFRRVRVEMKPPQDFLLSS
jgi:hypothetical protein